MRERLVTPCPFCSVPAPGGRENNSGGILEITADRRPNIEIGGPLKPEQVAQAEYVEYKCSKGVSFCSVLANYRDAQRTKKELAKI